MVIVGLGNIGKEYENTHHNAGFMFVDEVAKTYNVDFGLETKFQAFVAPFYVNGKKHFLLKPTTYMNLSGNAVRSFIDYYKIDVEDVFIVYDDMDLPLGTMRIRKSGSSGGHNGIKSLISCLGTEKFARLRLGTGRSKDRSEQGVVDFVLSSFTPSEKVIFNQVLESAGNIADDLLNKNLDFVMNKYNKKEK